MERGSQSSAVAPNSHNETQRQINLLDAFALALAFLAIDELVDEVLSEETAQTPSPERPPP